VRLLLDTHALLWWALDDPKLSAAARDVIADPGSRVSVSAASMWEISTKSARGRLPVKGDLRGILARQPIHPLPITADHAWAAGQLPLHHRDPFDRILVAQAQLEGLTIVTRDPDIVRYQVAILPA